MERRFYAVEIAYEGGRFRGFQAQPGLPTIQGALDAALASPGIRATLAVAARTDAGVHAVRQVVSFAARAALDPEALRRGLNAALPEGIVALAAHAVPSSFHARNSAVARTYVYLVGTPPPEALRPYAWTLPDARAFPDVTEPRLDPDRLRAALAHAVGTHDFVGFARPGEQRDTRRSLVAAEVRAAAGMPLWALALSGRGFLRAMVRNLAGTAVAVGLGLAPPERVAEILSARRRYRGVRAPGWGLTLAEVVYQPPLFPRPA